MSALLELGLIALAQATPTPTPAPAATGAATPADDLGAAPIAAASPETWPGFRGLGTGHTRARGLPLTWSDDESLAWSVELPGFGQSSPVVWRDRVFVTAVEGENKEHCHVVALDLVDGQVLWERTLPATLRIPFGEMVSRGAPSPAVDAQRLYAFFESGDLFALDHDGELLWTRSLASDYGEFGGNHGIASSVVRSATDLFVLVDHDGPSYLLSLDPASGANRWRLERQARVSWTTPVVAPDGELVVSSNGRVEGLDPRDGAVRWALDDLRGNTAASPTVVGDSLVVGSSEGEANVRVRRRADAAEVLWRPSKARPSGFGSPLVAGDRVFVVSKSGTLSAFAWADGGLAWERRLPEGTWASPITDGRRAWFFGKDGTTVVIDVAAGEDDEPLAENTLTLAGPVYAAAAVDGAILLRTGRRLFAVGRTSRDAR